MGIVIRKSKETDGPKLVEIWKRGIDATHAFLDPDYREHLQNLVEVLLPHEDVWVAVGEDDEPRGFMLFVDNHIEALFVDPTWFRNGIGTQLIDYAVSICKDDALPITVYSNEQNTQAVAFYTKYGFVETGWSMKDDFDRDYPLIRFSYKQTGEGK